jgi:RNA polymerase sigma factor (sigma-70 family)
MCTAILTIISGNIDRNVRVSRINNTDQKDLVSRFGQLYDEHFNCVYRYVVYRVGDRSAAADLTSAVFEKALASFRNYRPDRAAPQTWLIAIARNTVIDYMRKSSRRNTVNLDAALSVEAADPSPQEAAESREEREVLRLCYAVLQQREQEIVSLKFGADLNNRKIAAVIGLSENNIGTILFRAISKLRQCFQEWLNGKGRI